MRVASAAQFLATPVGHYVAGRNWMIWCTSPTLIGSTFWGTPSGQDLLPLIPLYDCDRGPQIARPFDVVSDGRRLRATDADAYAAVVDYISGRAADYASTVRRWALVFADGVPGAAMAGFMAQLRPAWPWQAFAHTRDAFAWLERKNGAQECAAVESLVEGAMEVSPLVRELRARLEERVDEPLVDVAAALKLSTRSLQRALKAAGTSFIDEVARSRVAQAAIRLAETDAKIEAIAAEVGCASPSHLTTLFARFLGETPTEYRARRRGKR